MQEGDVQAFGALARGLVDQLHAAGGQLVQIGLQARCAESDVLDALTLLLDELADRAFRIGRLEQLDLRLADLEERRANLLLLDLLDGIALHAQLLFPERDGFVKALDGDADVFNVCQIHFDFLAS